MTELKKNIFNTIDDLLGSFFYYDRKEDESLGRGDIEKAVREGVITKQEIIDRFIHNIDEGLEESHND